MHAVENAWFHLANPVVSLLSCVVAAPHSSSSRRRGACTKWIRCVPALFFPLRLCRAFPLRCNWMAFTAGHRSPSPRFVFFFTTWKVCWGRRATVRCTCTLMAWLCVACVGVPAEHRVGMKEAESSSSIKPVEISEDLKRRLQDKNLKRKARKEARERRQISRAVRAFPARVHSPLCPGVRSPAACGLWLVVLVTLLLLVVVVVGCVHSNGAIPIQRTVRCLQCRHLTLRGTRSTRPGETRCLLVRVAVAYFS